MDGLQSIYSSITDSSPEKAWDVPLIGKLSLVGLVVFIGLIIWVVITTTGWAMEDFKGGNFATSGNAPLWEGGSLSDQANLAVSPAYADRSALGTTDWLACKQPGAASDAALFAQAHQ